MDHTSLSAPYFAPALDDDLRMEWLKAGLLSPAGPMRKIAVVGGILNKYNEMYSPDRRHLTAIVRMMKKHGYALGTGFKISWYNMLPPMKNDFLHAALSPRSNTPNTNALILLGVPSLGTPGWVRDATVYDDDIDRQVMQDYFNIPSNMSIVSRMTRPGVWPHAAVESGAQVIATWGGRGDEISTDTFKDDKQGRFEIVKPTGKDASLSSWGDEGIGIIKCALDLDTI
ncbi:MAG TPA: hypothetical protein PLO23_00760 [Alphaproteobacteria bacterium]|nr:hypothetical protein [Alphaproteobacteria bacterium]